MRDGHSLLQDQMKALHAQKTFVIEKGIPLPECHRGGRPRIYPWEKLEVSDSVLVASYDIARQGQAWAMRHSRAFVYAKQRDGSGWRVWRTE